MLLHLAATLYMVGVIWFVQVVHYPLFSKVGGPERPRPLQLATHRRLERLRRPRSVDDRPRYRVKAPSLVFAYQEWYI
jgi:hypothetical protein